MNEKLLQELIVNPLAESINILNKAIEQSLGIPKELLEAKEKYSSATLDLRQANKERQTTMIERPRGESVVEMINLIPLSEEEV